MKITLFKIFKTFMNMQIIIKIRSFIYYNLINNDQEQ